MTQEITLVYMREENEMIQKLINSALVGWMFAAAVFGSVAYYAYYTAYTLHTTGSELIKLLVG